EIRKKAEEEKANPQNLPEGSDVSKVGGVAKVSTAPKKIEIVEEEADLPTEPTVTAAEHKKRIQELSRLKNLFIKSPLLVQVTLKSNDSNPVSRITKLTRD